jgi:predicted lipoprotein
VKLHRWAAVVLAATIQAAAAQNVPANVAVPFYGPPAFVKGAYQYWYVPRANEFANEAAALPIAIERLCKADAAAATEPLQHARTRWQSAVQAWDALSVVAAGPLVQRRSARQIDFAPTRPELIARAVRSDSADAQTMERVGTPAKGFPALEWLLWTQPVTPGTPACRYAVLAAREIEAEAKALTHAFGELAARNWSADEAVAVAAMSELLNQWVGGLERLRWAHMEKPLRSARTSSARNNAPAYPRAASGSTRKSWAAQWQGLRALGVAQNNEVPAPGSGLVPLETYLRGRGLNPLANKVAGAAGQVTRQLQAADPSDANRTLAAARAVSGLKRLAEAEIAPALEVNIGFSDSDGD